MYTLITKSQYIPTNFTGIAESTVGSFYYKDGKLHREDGPAKYWKDDSKHEYWLEGKFLGLSRQVFEFHLNNLKAPEDPYKNKVVEIDGKKYTLTPVP